jgi:molybdopterin-binding protein
MMVQRPTDAQAKKARASERLGYVHEWTGNFDQAMEKSNMSTSIRNRLAGTIINIVSGDVVSEIVIRTAAGEVTSIITTGSVKRMNLRLGDNAFAIIKATEVSVEKE